jgi:hypothetical protein
MICFVCHLNCPPLALYTTHIQISYTSFCLCFASFPTYGRHFISVLLRFLYFCFSLFPMYVPNQKETEPEKKTRA